MTGHGVNAHGPSRRHIIRRVEATLRRPQTHRIDLYYAHDPTPMRRSTVPRGPR